MRCQQFLVPPSFFFPLDIECITQEASSTPHHWSLGQRGAFPFTCGTEQTAARNSSL